MPFVKQTRYFRALMPLSLGLLLAMQADSVSARHLAHLPSAKPQLKYSAKQPGTGYPGRLTPYVTRSAKLKVLMRRYSMSAGWFVRDPVDETRHFINSRTCATNAIPYLLYSPKRPHGPLPLVVYFGGLGEWGDDLELQFRQKTVFNRVTSPEFQKRHPCYLFAPMLPRRSQIWSAVPEGPSTLADLVSDAMYAVIHQEGSRAVDTNRLYTTGFSAGGAASFALMSAYPGRFAAAIPVSTYHPAEMVPKTKPGSYWIIYNEGDFLNPAIKRVVEDFSKTVSERGGEVRTSSFPREGHNAWDAAWSEDAVWDWLFQKTAFSLCQHVEGLEVRLIPKTNEVIDTVPWPVELRVVNRGTANEYGYDFRCGDNNNPTVRFFVVHGSHTNEIQRPVLDFGCNECDSSYRKINILPGSSLQRLFNLGIDWVSGRSIFKEGTNHLFATYKTPNGILKTATVMATRNAKHGDHDIMAFLSNSNRLMCAYNHDTLEMVPMPQSLIDGILTFQNRSGRLDAIIESMLADWRVKVQNAWRLNPLSKMARLKIPFSKNKERIDNDKSLSLKVEFEQPVIHPYTSAIAWYILSNRSDHVKSVITPQKPTIYMKRPHDGDWLFYARGTTVASMQDRPTMYSLPPHAILTGFFSMDVDVNGQHLFDKAGQYDFMVSIGHMDATQVTVMVENVSGDEITAMTKVKQTKAYLWFSDVLLQGHVSRPLYFDKAYDFPSEQTLVDIAKACPESCYAEWIQAGLIMNRYFRLKYGEPIKYIPFHTTHTTWRSTSARRLCAWYGGLERLSSHEPQNAKRFFEITSAASQLGFLQTRDLELRQKKLNEARQQRTAEKAKNIKDPMQRQRYLDFIKEVEELKRQERSSDSKPTHEE